MVCDLILQSQDREVHLGIAQPLRSGHIGAVGHDQLDAHVLFPVVAIFTCKVCAFIFIGNADHVIAGEQGVLVNQERTADIPRYKGISVNVAVLNAENATAVGLHRFICGTGCIGAGEQPKRHDQRHEQSEQPMQLRISGKSLHFDSSIFSFFSLFRHEINAR